VDLAQSAAGRAWVELAARLDVRPEGDDVTAVAVRPGRKEIARRHDRSARARSMRRDRKLADHVVFRRPIRIRPPARHPRNDPQRTKVDEDMPRVAQHNRIVAA
jgi:hypothetical protein